MLFFVIVELSVVGAEGYLVLQAEKEAKRAEHVKEIIAKTNHLVQVCYDTGTSVMEYAKSKDETQAARYKQNRDETKEILVWLKEALKDDPENLAILNRVDANLQIGMSAMDKIKQAVDTQPLLVAVRYGFKEKNKLQPTFDALVRDLLSLVRAQRRIEEESPAAQRSQRESQKVILLAGLVLNVVLAFAGAGWFTRKLTSRLDVLVENTKRMKRGEELSKPLYGSDEIAALDSTFHEMAYTLRLKEQLLKDSEARVRAIIEKVPVGLVVFSEEGTIEFVNPTLAAMFREEPEELVGRALSSLMSRSQATSDSEFSAQLNEKAMERIFEVTCLRKDTDKTNDSKISGSSDNSIGFEKFPVEFSMTVFETEDGAKRLGILLDVSERQEIQRMRQAFVSMVSHELRTPLTAVSGFISLLEMGAFGEVSKEATEQAGRAEANVSRLMKLITELLDLEKMDSGTLNVSKAKCKLQKILESTDEASRSFAESKGIKLEIDSVDGGENVELYADADRIVQVLVNLISNAVKFSPPQGTVRVAYSLDDEFLEMRVTDQGRGVPAKYKEVIFERFQQVDVSDAKQKGGTGLGLAICKTIVEMHDGTIAVDSEEGKGSTFWFRIKRNKS
jgi:PAS domain S-box-containing protein